MIKPFQNAPEDRPEPADGELECALCQRGVRTDKAKVWLHVVDGGTRFRAQGEVYTDRSSDMGCFPVGSTCYRKHRKDIQALAHAKTVEVLCADQPEAM